MGSGWWMVKVRCSFLALSNSLEHHLLPVLHLSRARNCRFLVDPVPKEQIDDKMRRHAKDWFLDPKHMACNRPHHTDEAS